MAFPSTFLDIQTAVIVKARLDPTLDLQKTKDWINQTYFQVVVETEAIVTTATMNLAAGSFRYTLPAGVARIRQMYLTPAGQTDAVGEQPPLIRTSHDDILQRRQFGQAAQQAGSYSTHYALLGASSLEFWPTPAAIDVVTIDYAAFPTALASNGDLQVLDEPYGSKLLEYGALAQAGEFKGDPMTDGWQQDFDSWMGRYMNHLDEKQGDIPAQYHQWGSLRDTAELYGG